MFSLSVQGYLILSYLPILCFYKLLCVYIIYLLNIDYYILIFYICFTSRQSPDYVGQGKQSYTMALIILWYRIYLYFPLLNPLRQRLPWSCIVPCANAMSIISHNDHLVLVFNPLIRGQSSWHIILFASFPATWHCLLYRITRARLNRVADDKLMWEWLGYTIPLPSFIGV
jgi:hypothetical protein